jgi:hypothetical protein
MGTDRFFVARVVIVVAALILWVAVVILLSWRQ